MMKVTKEPYLSLELNTNVFSEDSHLFHGKLPVERFKMTAPSYFRLLIKLNSMSLQDRQLYIILRTKGHLFMMFGSKSTLEITYNMIGWALTLELINHLTEVETCAVQALKIPTIFQGPFNTLKPMNFTYTK